MRTVIAKSVNISMIQLTLHLSWQKQIYKWSLPNFPKGTGGRGGHTFTYIYFTNSFTQIVIYFKTDIHTICKFIQKDTLLKFSCVSTDTIKIE